MVGVPLPTALLLTTAQAAGYLGVSVNTFRAHVRVSPVKIGSSVRFDRRDLDRWVAQQSGSVPMTADDWLGMLDEDSARVGA